MSTIQGRMLVEHPDDVLITLKLTMSARDWCSLRDQLEHAPYPSWKVRALITQLLAAIRKVHYEETELESQ